MNKPTSLLLLFGLFILLMVYIQIGVFSIAFSKLGISEHGISLLLFSSLLGSTVNLPLFKIKADPDVEPEQVLPQRILFGQKLPFTGKTIVAINVGGAIIPLLFSIYLLLLTPVNLFQSILAIGIVASVSFTLSRPIKGLGIGMPILVAPLTAVLSAWVIAPEHSAALAYISGTLGVLTGADLFRLKDIRRLAAPVASIGGAGTFDGIFITGIVAVLLA